MANKSVGAHGAYKSKGMKAPRPESGPALDPSKAPSNGPKHASKGDSYNQSPKNGEQSAAPEHKKKGTPSKEAPSSVSSESNQGGSYSLPKSGGRGESEV